MRLIGDTKVEDGLIIFLIEVNLTMSDEKKRRELEEIMEDWEEKCLAPALDKQSERRERNIFETRDHQEMMERKIRVLIGKAGLDGHEVGARVVAKALADAGMEVIYTGLRQTPEMIVKTAIEEGVDLIGISILSGSHMTFLPEILRLMDHYGAKDIYSIAGGIIPTEDIETLKQMGVKEIFPPETPTQVIVGFVKGLIDRK